MDFATLSVCIYLIICILAGTYRMNSVKTFAQYAMGTGGISTVALLATIYATKSGAGSSLGVIERILQDGIMLMVVGILCIPIPWLIVEFIFCRNVWRFQGCMTSVDVLEKQYAILGKILGQLIFIFFGILIIALQFLTLQSMFVSITGMDETAALIFGATTISMYTIGGGIRGVVITDILQASLFLGILPIIGFACLSHFNGFSNILSSIPVEKLWYPHDFSTWINVLHICLFMIIIDIAEGPFIQRVLISNNKAQLKKVFFTSAMIDILVFLFLSIIGLSLLSHPEIQNRDDMINLIIHNMDPVLSAFTIIGIFAAIMGNADSWINTISIVVTKSIYKQPSVRNARFITLFVSVGSVMMSSYFSSLLDILYLMVCITPITAVPLAVAFLGYPVNQNDLKRMLIFTIPTFCLSILIEGEPKFSVIPIMIVSIISLLWGKQKLSLQKSISRSLKSISHHLNNINITIWSVFFLLFIFMNWDYSDTNSNLIYSTMGFLIMTLNFFYIITNSIKKKSIY